MKRLIIILAAAALTAVVAGVVAHSASAASWPDSRLDTAAASVAGKPVSVWCEASWGDWIHTGDSISEDFGLVAGFTAPSYSNVIYVAPDVCETLHAMLDDEDIGTYHAAYALGVLAHEARHQAGTISEGQADCEALQYVESMAVNSFGYPAQIAQKYIAKAYRTVQGRRVATKVVRTRYVRNPWLNWLNEDAMRWHRSAPAEYQGDC
jgi:hypothetical protein